MSEIFSFETSAFLPGVKAAVFTETPKDFFAKPAEEPPIIKIKNKNFNPVSWGSENNLPLEIIEKVGKNPVMSSGILFNIQVGYGEGIKAVRWIRDKNGKIIDYVEVYDNKEIQEFFEENDIQLYLLEQLTDLNYFYFNVAEVICNRENKPKIVTLRHKEATFSRWNVVNDKGLIDYHLYYHDWKNVDQDKVIPTQVLDPYNTVRDLRIKMGLEKDDSGKFNTRKDFRYIIPIQMPSPGRVYYPKPYWFSAIESGWYDFACSIPAFKKALMKNQMTLKYVVYLHKNYFNELFSFEGITEKVKQKERIKTEHENIQKWLTNVENTGKAIITTMEFSLSDAKEIPRIKVVPIENKFVGGEYLEDSQESASMLSYALGVHPSLIGSTPGKNTGSFSGTDKRELFLIKQMLLKPIRDRILRPLYVIKRFNNWPDDIDFTIPNMNLTTLDKSETGTTETSQK